MAHFYVSYPFKPYLPKDSLMFAKLTTWLAPWLVCYFLCFPFLTFATQLTLKEAILLGMRHNKKLKSEQLQNVLTKFAIEVAEDDFEPQIKFGFKWEKSPQQPPETTLQSEATLKNHWGGILGLNLEQPWFSDHENQWSLWYKQPLLKNIARNVVDAPLYISRLQWQQQQLAYQQTQTDLIVTIIKAYRNVLQAQQRLDIGQLSLKRSKKLLKINQILIETGRMAAVDMIQTEADIASKELDERLAQNELDSARLNLLKVLDLHQQTDIELQYDLQVTPPPSLTDQAQLTAQMLQNRSDYLQNKVLLAQLQWQLLLAKEDKKWDLDLTSRYQHQTDVSDSMAQQAWSISLSLNIPLKDLKKQQAFLAAKTAVQQQQLLIAQQGKELEMALLDLLRNLNLQQEQLKLSSQVRVLAEKKLDIEQTKLTIGRSSNFQLVSFQDDLIQAQQTELTAKINYLNSLTDLDHLLGTTLETWHIEVVYE